MRESPYARRASSAEHDTMVALHTVYAPAGPPEEAAA
jgi:hypothetical protein